MGDCLLVCGFDFEGRLYVSVYGNSWNLYAGVCLFLRNIKLSYVYLLRMVYKVYFIKRT